MIYFNNCKFYRYILWRVKNVLFFNWMKFLVVKSKNKMKDKKKKFFEIKIVDF